MAGTYADQITLAGTNDFVNLVKAALMKNIAAAKVSDDAALASAEAALATAQANLVAARRAVTLNAQVIGGIDGWAQRLAFIIATTNATVGAAAPTVPSEGDTQYCVNNAKSLLLI